MAIKAICRGALGFPLGICIGYVITIGVSLAWGDGTYQPCVYALVEEFGSELAAVVFQAALCGALGATFAASSVIWEMEKWSLARQTGVHFLVASLVMLPIAYFARWMERSLGGLLVYFGIFIALFAIMWLVQYLIWRNLINRINQRVGMSE
ncbi:MAG: DUF3021 domain-containing protein [Coriobacteriales bacterium]|jgi:hypothetical protein|nr:DUF3021 domain-containing protein [Coriobacteriales bacterium]